MNFSNFYEIITDKIVGWVESFVAMLPNIASAFLIIIGFIILAKLSKKIIRKISNRLVKNQSLTNIFTKIIYIAIIVVGCFIALSVLNLQKTVTSLLAGAGIVGLALGFAFQDIAANFMSGFMMAAKKPFHVGDVIETKDHVGVVQKINLRTTEIKSFQGQEIIIPNKEVFQSPLINNSANGKIRIDLGVGVSYGEDLKQVREIAIAAVENVPGRTEDEIKLYYTEFGDSSINFFIAIWVKYGGRADYLQSQSEAIIAIKEAFDKNDIMIPFPIRTLDFGIKGGEKLNEMMPLELEKKE